ncbi:MAG: prolyl oligopeptidase family serine peptidase [Pseudomonadota bacterium]
MSCTARICSRSRIPTLASALLAALMAGGCATQLKPTDVAHFQPPIVRDRAPERPLKGTYSLANNTRKVGLDEMRAQVPAFDGRGRLLASWNPHPHGVSGRRTFVVVHGGHGLVPSNFATALWLREAMGANVLVLDSYWSRGREENWATWNEFGANMRALDAIAAARWLRDAHGVSPSRLYLYGDSQGGWTVLRTFTDEPFLRSQVAGLYAAGIALYPNCIADGSPQRPALGPYVAPVIVFTGGRDTATPIQPCDRSVFTRAADWIHYADQTHGWDTANRGAHTPAVDGECGKAMNVYNRFAVCRSDLTTADMRRRIGTFVDSIETARR